MLKWLHFISSAEKEEIFDPPHAYTPLLHVLEGASKPPPPLPSPSLFSSMRVIFHCRPLRLCPSLSFPHVHRVRMHRRERRHQWKSARVADGQSEREIEWEGESADERRKREWDERREGRGEKDRLQRHLREEKRHTFKESLFSLSCSVHFQASRGGWNGKLLERHQRNKVVCTSTRDYCRHEGYCRRDIYR